MRVLAEERDLAVLQVERHGALEPLVPHDARLLRRDVPQRLNVPALDLARCLLDLRLLDHGTLKTGKTCCSGIIGLL